MPFDVTQPADSTKLRNDALLVRNNFSAVQTADSTFTPRALNLANRTALGLGDPAAIGNTYILYAKQDGAGSVQLYGINQASTVVQISNAWGPLSATNGVTWLAGGMLMQWGTAAIPNGISGNINFPVAFSAAAYNVQVTPIMASGDDPTVSVSSGSVTSSRFHTRNTGSATNIFWLAIGPKV